MFPISASRASRVADRFVFSSSAAANHARRTLRLSRQRIASTLARASGPSPLASRRATSRHAPSAEAIRRVRSRVAFLSSTSLAASTSSLARTRSTSRSLAASLASASAASTSSAMRLRRSASSRVAIAALAAASLRSLAALAAARRAAIDASSASASIADRSRSAFSASRLSRSRSARTSSSAACRRASIRWRAARVRSSTIASRNLAGDDVLAGLTRPAAPTQLAPAAMSAARARISLASGLPATGRSVAESSAAPFAARTTRVGSRGSRSPGGVGTALRRESDAFHRLMAAVKSCFLGGGVGPSSGPSAASMDAAALSASMAS